MEKIKCFMVEKTGEHRYELYDWLKPEDKCSCGKLDCPTNGGNVPLWKRLDTGEILTQDNFPAGAMWFAPWYADHCAGFDGRSLVVLTPAGEWLIDSQASNCTRKGDKTHRCWLREGEAPNITVEKSGGQTCAAGAGSILIDRGDRKYHGFLRNGFLESC